MADGTQRRVRQVAATAITAVVLVVVAGVAIVRNADFDAPPRYDGAGYAVLARSLIERGDYREIDHPDAPRHAHFPPGYPAGLVLVWSVAEPSPRAAHLASGAATIAAVLVFWAWFRQLYRPGVAFGLALALAANWTWGRVGAAIQSEPLFLLLSGLTLFVASSIGRRGGRGSSAVLALLLGGAVLTRQIGIGLALAVTVDLWLRGRRREAVLALALAAMLVVPWIGWVRSVDGPTQVDLLPRAGLVAVLRGNAVFYLRRLPDAIWGPLIEVGTVFRPEWRRPATWIAAALTGLIVGGWWRALKSRRRRVAAMAAGITMAMLLAWPFTEAGRFLIPLVPLILVGLLETLAATAACVGLSRPRGKVAALLVAASLPYAAYAAATDRAGALRRDHEGIDAACAWLATPRAITPGPVLSRHPGEIFWQSGRRGLAPTDDLGEIDATVARYGVAYLLVDEERFAKAPASPLGRFVRERSEWKVVWSGPSTTIYGRDRVDNVPE